jgi:hypothetical protein
MRIHASRQRIKSGILATSIAAAVLSGCSQHRPQVPESRLVQDEQAYHRLLADQAAQRTERIVARLERKYDAYAAGRTKEPPTADVLILSGGGEFGAFGAGFLNGWAEVRDPAWTRPEFDIVTGVSTGSLIAPFAFVGDKRSYEHILRLYQQPKQDWAVLRGILFFLPGNPSLLSIDGLQKELRGQVDDEIVRAIAAASRDGRVLCVASTNLDYGEQRIFDLGVEAERGSADRIHEMLLASSAIPGAFPPRIIDGCMYVDGGVTSNILYNPDITSPSSAMTLWRRRHPDRPVPRQRIWVVINEQFHGAPQVVQPSWVDIAGASVSEMVRSSTLTALRQLWDEAAAARAAMGVEIEVRYVAIPDDWRDPASDTGMFDRKTMDSLAKLGLKLGADPSSWKTFDMSGSSGQPAARLQTRP